MKKQTIFLSILALGCMFILAMFAVLLVLVASRAPSSGSRLDMGLGSRVAVVDIEGVIFDSPQTRETLNLIEEYGNNSRVKAIVLNINSPGGGVAPSQELYNQVLRVREKHGKLVVASFSSMAASGGYYVGCAADRVVAAPGCITGSIGVYMQFADWQGLYDKIGIGFRTIQAGEFKTAGASDRPMAATEEAMLKSMVDDIYDQFVGAVIDQRYENVRRLMYDELGAVADEPRVSDAEQRAEAMVNEWLAALLEEDDGDAEEADTEAALAPDDATAEAWAGDATTHDATQSEVAQDELEESSVALIEDATDVLAREADGPVVAHEEVIARIHELANGRVYTGRQARDVGLVDELGHLDDAIKLAARLAGIPGDPVVMRRDRRRDSGLGLFGQLSKELSAHREGTRPFVAYLFPYAGRL